MVALVWKAYMSPYLTKSFSNIFNKRWLTVPGRYNPTSMIRKIHKRNYLTPFMSPKGSSALIDTQAYCRLFDGWYMNMVHLVLDQFLTTIAIHLYLCVGASSWPTCGYLTCYSIQVCDVKTKPFVFSLNALCYIYAKSHHYNFHHIHFPRIPN